MKPHLCKCTPWYVWYDLMEPHLLVCEPYIIWKDLMEPHPLLLRHLSPLAVTRWWRVVVEGATSCKRVEGGWTSHKSCGLGTNSTITGGGGSPPIRVELLLLQNLVVTIVHTLSAKLFWGAEKHVCQFVCLF